MFLDLMLCLGLFFSTPLYSYCQHYMDSSSMSPNPTDISARLHVRGSTKPKAEVSHDIVPSATGELLEVDDIPGHIVQRKVMSGIVPVRGVCGTQHTCLVRSHSVGGRGGGLVQVLPGMKVTKWEQAPRTLVGAWTELW
ncbi:uncharacterized protein LOC112571680 isoform X2 [Pomacea canaliculata]|uniref:uncharacterized protein LOC112571680 isoform X2 n=1 Tax=Pomacea canaliculata TaxID=400727 RepID=UPI000D737DF2|nr:uncharacterized protein LOC112571680 isoform X2 [Pomacea canaliculata]